MSHDSLGDRMKGYEDVSRTRLTRRSPVIVRVDGKAFHTLTRTLDKPYDEHFTRCMDEVALGLCREIQGAALAYVQSDEVSVLLVDYHTHETQAWFDNQVQKMASVAASTATVAFNLEWLRRPQGLAPGWGKFDARVFSVPREEVVNYFVWRQQDAVRNSIQGLAQANFSQKALHGLSCDQLQEKLFQERGINWSRDVPVRHKRGGCARYKLENVGEGMLRGYWEADREIPTFTQDRAYVQRLVDVGE